MNLQQQSMQEDPIAWRAGEWLLELDSPQVSVERIAEWQQWMAADERHRHAYEALAATWGQAAHIAPAPWPAENEIRTDTYEPSRTISAWQATKAPRQRWFVPLTAAATLGALAIGASFMLPDRIQTDVGQSRQLQLSDGSQLFVAPGSLLSVDIDEHARIVTLKRGEAYFEVAKDAARPFSVRAGATDITALGTAFNVRRTGSQIVVAVSEGAVAVTGEHRRNATPRLDAGQRIVLEPTQSASAAEPIAPQAVASWREGRLQFSGEPLANVVADVNRYSARRLEIADPAIASLRVTGTVSAGNVESWLRSLEKALSVRVQSNTDGSLRLSAPH